MSNFLIPEYISSPYNPNVSNPYALNVAFCGEYADDNRNSTQPEPVPLPTSNLSITQSTILVPGTSRIGGLNRPIPIPNNFDRLQNHLLGNRLKLSYYLSLVWDKNQPPSIDFIIGLADSTLTKIILTKTFTVNTVGSDSTAFLVDFTDIYSNTVEPNEVFTFYLQSPIGTFFNIMNLQFDMEYIFNPAIPAQAFTNTFTTSLGFLLQNNLSFTYPYLLGAVPICGDFDRKLNPLGIQFDIFYKNIYFQYPTLQPQVFEYITPLTTINSLDTEVEIGRFYIDPSYDFAKGPNTFQYTFQFTWNPSDSFSSGILEFQIRDSSGSNIKGETAIFYSTNVQPFPFNNPSTFGTQTDNDWKQYFNWNRFDAGYTYIITCKKRFANIEISNVSFKLQFIAGFTNNITSKLTIDTKTYTNTPLLPTYTINNLIQNLTTPTNNATFPDYVNYTYYITDNSIQPLQNINTYISSNDRNTTFFNYNQPVEAFVQYKYITDRNPTLWSPSSDFYYEPLITAGTGEVQIGTINLPLWLGDATKTLNIEVNYTFKANMFAVSGLNTNGLTYNIYNNNILLTTFFVNRTSSNTDPFPYNSQTNINNINKIFTCSIRGQSDITVKVVSNSNAFGCTNIGFLINSVKIVGITDDPAPTPSPAPAPTPSPAPAPPIYGPPIEIPPHYTRF